jgi:hypothetical protein
MMTDKISSNFLWQRGKRHIFFYGSEQLFSCKGALRRSVSSQLVFSPVGALGWMDGMSLHFGEFPASFNTHLLEDCLVLRNKNG